MCIRDRVSAVFALGGEDDLVRLMARVDSLAGFLDSEDGEHLLTAYKRAANILRIEEKKDGQSYAGAPDTARFNEDQERALRAAILDVNQRSSDALEGESYEEAMALMSNLRRPVDEFFDHVTVNGSTARSRICRRC